jgi:hypothetical protein
MDKSDISSIRPQPGGFWRTLFQWLERGRLRIPPAKCWRVTV